MDAGGKDGAIRHVMSGVNPQGCQVFSFKQPSADELEHDFLWRTMVRVHPEILRAQGLSKELRDEQAFWERATAPSWIWKAIPIATERGPLNSSSICRRMNKESGSWSALMPID
jgi:hypothetical protein